MREDAPVLAAHEQLLDVVVEVRRDLCASRHTPEPTSRVATRRLRPVGEVVLRHAREDHAVVQQVLLLRPTHQAAATHVLLVHEVRSQHRVLALGVTEIGGKNVFAGGLVIGGGKGVKGIVLRGALRLRDFGSLLGRRHEAAF